MTGPLGLSIGTTNLVGARIGSPPLTRRAVLTWSHEHAPQVGVPLGMRDPGTVTIAGFVERVGDPIPLVAADGSQHRADQLMVAALAAMVDAVGGPASKITIARPSHWGPAAVSALREALLAEPMFARNGVAVPMVPDATAALTALAVDPGLPADGLVGLIDFGASGTSLTLADAGSGFRPVDDTLRYTEFSGDQIDQLLLTFVLNKLAGAHGLDTSATAAVGALGRLRDRCRDAKERLSSESAAEVDVDLPLHRSRIRLTRSELEDQIATPLASALAAFGELLHRNAIGPSGLAALATVGGGAGIPLITQRISEELRIPVVTTPRPELNAAAGAAMASARGPVVEAPTAMTTAPGHSPEAPTALAGAVFAPAPDESDPTAVSALAWSEDAGGNDELVPYTGEDYAYPSTGVARPPVQFLPPAEPVAERPTRWYRRPMAVVGLAALVPLVAVGAFAYVLTGSEQHTPETRPSTAVVSAPSSVPGSAPVPTSIAPNLIEGTSAPAPAPAPATPAVTTVAPPPTSAPPAPPATTKTTAMPTTTVTTAPTTTTLMTTTYLTVPFLPVPIPIQVPAPTAPQ
ncbi:MAG: Hsp70 family protein [Mycobacterium sp.]|uniref:Hsp70 family protein n=1 Tax=Mycobacterium sp. TaxID=1785 RepID=UPI001EBFE69C|nr:Hsp70 family protein [Mycobacterium sp.]MBV8785450.1 Hsp70 family protein [Mycobacterium sp.]